jgi:hypothetical protein
MATPTDLASILQQYVNAAQGRAVPGAEDHYNNAVEMSPRDSIGQAIAAALRSDQTPPAPDMVAQMFGRSNPMQQAGLLNHLIRALGPAVLAGIAGKVMAGLQERASAAPAGRADIPPPQVTPREAQQITPQQISEITKQAAEKDPSVLDKLGSYYAQHPELVKTLGGAALTIALAKLAQGMRRG